VLTASHANHHGNNHDVCLIFVDDAVGHVFGSCVYCTYTQAGRECVVGVN
jgi:hypothetical protein